MASRCLSVISTVLLLALVLFCLPLTVPRFLGYQVYSVISGSMEPAIPTGSLVYIRETAPEELSEGEVIAFYGTRDSASIITHRVVENRAGEGEFVTKGDANAEADLYAAGYEDLIGRVSRHIPLLGSFLFLYTSSSGKIYAACFAGCGALLNLLAGRLRSRAG